MFKLPVQQQIPTYLVSALEASMQRVWVFTVLLLVLILGACSQKDSSQASSDAAAPHATVVLRDGTKLMGTVTSSTPSEITLNMDSGGTRTVLTKDVKSLDYGDPGASAASTPAAAPAAEAPRPERVHPEATAIQTKTFVIPAGTEVSVRNDETI